MSNLAVILFVIITGFSVGYFANRNLANKPTPAQSTVTNTSTPSDKAIELVRSRAEVKNWEALFTGPNQTSPSTGGKPAYDPVLNADGTYSVQVFENTADHTATFATYRVNLKTNQVTIEP